MNLVHKIANKLNGLVRHTNWFKYGQFLDCEKFWKYNTFNTKVVNLGSTSAVYAFDYSDLPIKAGNWALSHNPLSGDRAILKNYFSYLDPHKSTVLLPLCLFTSVSGSYDFMEDRYYTLLYPTSIPHFSYKRQQYVKNLRNRPLRSFPLFAIYSETKRLVKYLILGKHERTFNEQFMEEDAKRWINSWFKEFSIQSLDYPLSLLNKDGINDAASILNDIIFFCKERNITPVLVLPPVYHTLSEKYGEKGKQLLLFSLIDKIEDKSVKFLNYLDDDRFSHESTLFHDSYLLNKDGAKKFTKIVLSDIGILK